VGEQKLPAFIANSAIARTLAAMETTGNTILITGGGSGIGRGLAEAFHRLGNDVIITGRNQKALEETTAANPGMRYELLDVTDPHSIQSFAARAPQDYPSLNVLINNAGIMRAEDVRAEAIDPSAGLLASRL
jgi:uncharacterized oxidoreductase